MSTKFVGAAAIALLSGCTQSPAETRVVNRADVPLQVTYVARGNAVAQTLHLGAGETRLLGEGHRLSDYASVEFRDANRHVIFRDVDRGWRESDCVGDCTFTWLGNGKVAISA